SLERRLKALKDGETVDEASLQNIVAEVEEDPETGRWHDYWPAKLKIGKKHPDPVVCTASLASVESADIEYTFKIPEKIIDAGWLSALQLEAISYAAQAHERHLSDENRSRVGFLIGDGAGVGKGRTIAGIIYENYLHNRHKAVWISFSNDLKYDAERDFLDIGANIAVHALSKIPYNSRVSSAANGNITSGVLFCTYASLIAKSSTHSKCKLNTRMAQIIDWCGRDFNGCIVFDECHKAKNLVPAKSDKGTLTGTAIVELQKALSNARIVYSSATGATEPRNMAYMVRLGLWGDGTAFRNFHAFKKSVEKRGVSAMEIVAMDMKLRGMYVARQLSFQGVTFKVEKVFLTDEFIRTYNECVVLWILALKSFEQATYLMNVESKTKKLIFGQFWGAHQRFFKYMAIAAKVDHAVKITEATVRSGKAVFVTLVERQFPALNRTEKKFEETVEKSGTSRKRKRVTNILAKRSIKLNAKRRRIESSSDEDSQSKTIDSDDEYKPYPFAKNKVKKGIKKEEATEESDFYSEEDIEFLEYLDDSDFTIYTEDSDSDCGNKSKKKKKDSKNRMSKIQERLMKQHETANNKTSKNSVKSDVLRKEIIEGVRDMKDDLLKKIEQIGNRLPKNTLDDLINKLGGSKKVAEMTGRKGRVAGLEDGTVQFETRGEEGISLEMLNMKEKERFMNGDKGRVAGLEDGTVQFETRGEEGISLEMLNMKEKERFMNGDKLIAIISEAASSGISLQSDRRVKNQRRRLHITLELPWAADAAIQQFGRTHRSNQKNAPEYMFLISDLAGEQRFVATVARRLESLGALTHADRRAAQTRDLSQFNIDNKYGRKALSSTIRAIRKLENPMIPPPQEYDGDFFADAHKALLDVGLDLHAVADEGRKSDNIVRFLNRCLGVPVQLQNLLFKYFSDTLSATITVARRMSTFEVGIMDIGRPENINRISTKRFFHQHATGVAPVEIHTVRVDRGISWDEAFEKSKTLTKEHEGFYIYRDSRANKRKAILAARLTDDLTLPSALIMFAVHRPNTGLSMRNESLAHISRTYYKTTPEKAKQPWTYQYNVSSKECGHAFFSGRCATSRLMECYYGKRILTHVVLSGSLLGVWDRIERHLRGGENGLGQFVRMQVCLLRANDGQGSTTGILIPLMCVSELSDELAADAERVEDVYLSNDAQPQTFIKEVDLQNKKEEKVDPESMKEENKPEGAKEEHDGGSMKEEYEAKNVKEEIDLEITKEQICPERPRGEYDAGSMKVEYEPEDVKEEFEPEIVNKEEIDPEVVNKEIGSDSAIQEVVLEIKRNTVESTSKINLKKLFNWIVICREIV
ncbi:Protein strawberry notch like 1, partial [Pseudolycoriella hygida]